MTNPEKLAMAETTGHWSDTLPRRACSDAVQWARTQPDLRTAWSACERGDWMLWLAGYYAGSAGSDARRPLVLATCDCAGLARPHWREWDVPVLERALDTARRWARGEAGVTLADVRADADAAADAAYAADAYAAWAAFYAAAAWAAFYTADAAFYAAADAAWAAFYAVADAADAAYDADAAADARSRALRDCADIVRRYYPEPPAGKPEKERPV